MIDWGREHAPLVNGAQETQIFIRYWRTKERDFKKKNWRMTWENWILREQKRLQEVRERDAQRNRDRMTANGAYSAQYAPRDEPRCKQHPAELASHCTVCDSERRAVRTPQ
jgi:hypothetical protein